MDTLSAETPDPEQALLSKEASGLLEGAVLALPQALRQVFMLREVEGLTTVETADCLGLNPDTVKTRLHRARKDVRRRLSSQIVTAAPAAFVLHARRCDRVVAHVLAAVQTGPQSH